MAEAREAKSPDLGAVFDAHVRSEFVTKDVNATMETMTDDPYVHHVPTLVGGYGRKDVVDFIRTTSSAERLPTCGWNRFRAP